MGNIKSKEATSENSTVAPGERRFVSEWSHVDDLNIEEGDLIEINRKTYCHWAFYLGAGWIVHHNPKESEEKIGVLKLKQFVDGIVTRDELKHVVRSDQCRVNNKPDFSKAPRNIIDINRDAFTLINKSGIKYCLELCNCEHFATFLKFGHAFCEQFPLGISATNYISNPDESERNNSGPILGMIKFMATRTTDQWNEYLNAFNQNRKPNNFITNFHEDVNKAAEKYF